MPSPTAVRPIEGSERRPAPGARRVAAENPSAKLSVTIRVRRRTDAPSLPVHHNADTPTGHLSREEFAERFGASQADLDLVVAFARAKGLEVEETSTARRVVKVFGTVEQMNHAFGVDLGRYESPTETYRGREGAVNMPQDVSNVVEGVFGLDNRRMARRAGTRVAPRPPKAFGPTSGRVETVAVPTDFGPSLNVTALTPPQVASLYDYPLTPGAAGQTIGLIEFGGGFAQSDLNQFFSGLGGGLTAPTPTVVGMDGVTNNPGVDINADGEVTLDICVASSVASNADVAVYFAPWTEQGWVDVITNAVHDATNNPSVLSISWGWPEFEGIEGFTWTQQAINALNQTFQDAAALGVTVFAASGDSGSDCGQGDGAAHVLYPASDPFVSSCGGTRISDVSGASFTETTWAQSFGTTGGGISDFFSLPTYQIGAGVPLSANDGHQGRGIPDIAGNADPASGYNLIVDGSSFPGVGGTSATAPLYAALVALCNAKLGRSVGFLNPLLYALNNTGVIRDIADNASNATGGAPGYTAGPGWDGATGLGVVDGQGLLAALTARFTKEVTIITDRSTFGKDEIEAMLQISNPAVIDAAFYVTVDGFTPTELGITTTNPTPTQLQAWAPAFTESPTPTGFSIRPSALVAELPSLPAQPQRFTFVYQVVFANTSAFTAEDIPVALTATTHSTSGTAVIDLVTQPNPYIVDGPVSWLSTDVRVFQLQPGQSITGLPSVVMGTGSNAGNSFITNIIGAFNTHSPFGHPFDLISTDEDTSKLELSEKVNGTPVFNFAVARVRYRALSVDATQVRAFFRAFPASTTSTTFDGSTTYRSAVNGTTKIPLLGTVAGEVTTIPFFAAARVDTGSQSMDIQQDPANVQTIQHDASGNERDAYFGVWVDINQPNQLRFPVNVTSDGPFTSGRQSIQQLVRGIHQCMVVELAFDPEPITNGQNPATSDKLSQRNLSIVSSDNPGTAASHRIPNTFEIKPTHEILPPGWTPDEIMIDWGNTPAGGEATIYLPGAHTGEILDLAAKMYGMTTLRRIDDHTLACRAEGATWMPVPPGAGPGYAGLLTIDLPATVRRGQSFTVVIRQITSSAAKHVEPPTPQPRTRTKGSARPTPVPTKPTSRPESRHTLGAFQIQIPVRTKQTLLEPEERTYSVLKYIEQTIPHENRWYPVFEKYVGVIGDRVKALGGDPTRIRPSPDGSGVHPEPQTGPKPTPHHGSEVRLRFTGKVDGIVYDRFGDFEGFVLETEDGPRHFKCRETELENVLTRAWNGRVRTTVIVEADSEERPQEVILYAPPAPFRNGDGHR
jgi:cell division septation protein DedD